MPIVYIHGISYRSDSPDSESSWQNIKKNLRKYIAPVISANYEEVIIKQVYWGDIGVRFAWNGDSFRNRETLPDSSPLLKLFETQQHEDLSKELLSRALNLTGFGVTKAVDKVYLRQFVSEVITLWLGDIFVYLSHRGNFKNIGEIPSRIVEAMVDAKKNSVNQNEPLIVVSHSMGGQIVYDLVTHFLPNMPQYDNLKINFWCTCSSQVGLFEEMKVFLASDLRYDSKQRVPFPSRQHLGYWWNVWDESDYISFSAKDIFEGIDDYSYNSGAPAISAHFAVMEQPSFFVKFAEVLRSNFNL
ncbi:hypothetical protein APA_5416 [Pseudanabaena sp. lw0831]|uniref:hypothetical protein n=1 Tax=Pseudanabaena sp. lw0831 TaxID=1357935 RepID=UPI0019164419|nr:hypothetical protein [Pseudanabaena sp. lw0831]GBO52326.1 hypothetical protein APA_5416 [Pseudanabaena sp. lw0831]